MSDSKGLVEISSSLYLFLVFAILIHLCRMGTIVIPIDQCNCFIGMELDVELKKVDRDQRSGWNSVKKALVSALKKRLWKSWRLWAGKMKGEATMVACFFSQIMSVQGMCPLKIWHPSFNAGDFPGIVRKTVPWEAKRRDDGQFLPRGEIWCKRILRCCEKHWRSGTGFD